MTDVMELNFYSRCSPEQRPAFLRAKLRNAKEEDEDTAKVKIIKEKVDPDNKNAGGSSTLPLVDEKNSGSVYDAPLVKALHTTFFFRWWISGILKLCSGK